MIALLLAASLAGGLAAADPAAPAVSSDTAAFARFMRELGDSAKTEAYFDALRLGYAESEDYDPYASATQADESAMWSALKDEDFAETAARAAAVLARNPIHQEAHELAGIALHRLDERTRGAYHRFMAQGLLHSLLRSGDGKSPETAYRAVHIREEYVLIREQELHTQGRSSLGHGGRFYDAWILAPETPPPPSEGEKDGEPEPAATLYFDVTPIRAWALKSFTMPQ